MMQQQLINQLQQEDKTSITPWVYQYASAVLAAARTGGDVDAAAEAALEALPEGYELKSVKLALLEWANQ